MKITWQIEDGYLGGSRPHTTEVNDDELLECDTAQEMLEIISNAVTEDFQQKVSWAYKNYAAIEIKVEELLKRKKQDEEDDE